VSFTVKDINKTSPSWQVWL